MRQRKTEARIRLAEDEHNTSTSELGHQVLYVVKTHHWSIGGHLNSEIGET